jgi:hypothetical protein
MTTEQLNANAEVLLPSVRNYLDITWTDAATDEKVLGGIKRGMNYIDRVSGVENDYTIEDSPRELLFNYCRYDRSGATNEFRRNYAPELNILRTRNELIAYEATEV